MKTIRVERKRDERSEEKMENEREINRFRIKISDLVSFLHHKLMVFIVIDTKIK